MVWLRGREALDEARAGGTASSLAYLAQPGSLVPEGRAMGPTAGEATVMVDGDTGTVALGEDDEPHAAHAPVESI